MRINSAFFSFRLNRTAWLSILVLALCALLFLLGSRDNNQDSGGLLNRNNSSISAAFNSPDDAVDSPRTGITPEQIGSAVRSLLTSAWSASAVVRYSVSALSADLLDPSRPLKVRGQAARLLAKIGSDEALTILRQALRDAPRGLKTVIAEALGDTDHPLARTTLAALLKDKDPLVVRGAIRGVAAIGNEGSVRLLSEILLDPVASADNRAEAALFLGSLASPSAQDSLIQAMSKFEDKELAKTILAGLGRRSFAETEAFFSSYLDQPNLESEMRIAALEALGESKGNSSALLLNYIQDPSPEIRAAAAWALANLETPGEIAAQLLTQLANERETDVRTRIYQALENQNTLDAGSLLPAILHETDATARLAAFKLLAAQIGRDPNGASADQFDQLVVPQLSELAIQGADPTTRLSAVVALRQAKTIEGRRALERIAKRSAEPKIVAAAKIK